MSTSAINYAATDTNGSWVVIREITITVPGAGDVPIQVLPEISESKSAMVNDQNILGRSSPIKIYSGSSARTFSITLNYHILSEEDPVMIQKAVRALSAAVHPEYQGTYKPVPVCQIKIPGMIEDGKGGPAPVICKSYQITYDAQVWWYVTDELMMPSHISIATEWERVYSFQDLPGQANVIQGKY